VTALPHDEPAPLVTAVGVVIPARDEEERIAACLASVRRALAAAPGVIAAVAVVLDRCTDSTPARVAALLADWPEAAALTSADDGELPPSGRRSPTAWVLALPTAHRPGSGVGALRHQGVRHVLNRLAAHPPDATWLLSTDADTTVPADWVHAHLRLAACGVDAVAGLADLAGADHLSMDALLRYQEIIDRGLHGESHHHVYGANLGVRADAYVAVGGFPPDGVGEDHALWRRLRAAGYVLAQPVGIRVRTSARLRGRADDGLAGLLRALHQGGRRSDPARRRRRR
jgi:hypothetical protein